MAFVNSVSSTNKLIEITKAWGVLLIKWLKLFLFYKKKMNKIVCLLHSNSN